MLIQIYTVICLIRIVLTWMPQMQTSPFTQFLSKICDPYLDIFKQLHFLQYRTMDFSPIVALAVLSLVSNVFSSIARTGQFSIAVIFVSLFTLILGFLISIINILIVFFVIRLIYDLLRSTTYSPFWQKFDQFLNPIISKFVRTIFSNGVFTYRQSLLIAIGISVAIRILLVLFPIGLRYLFPAAFNFV